MAAHLKQTLERARTAMVGFGENMDALKRNFLLRGFFDRRGYFDRAEISPAAYRKGALVKDGRHLPRAWLRSDVLFAPDVDLKGTERLTDAGKALIDAAFALSLETAASGAVMVEGYAQQGALAMPLGAGSPGSPGRMPWDGVAIAVILLKSTITEKDRDGFSAATR